ncbi:hypothetical protein KSP39_PZI001365 [Platanthera zijinensis]|uniref:RAD50-interacting protein 1 n=1 Tax=Platanthera zijinensis TaxID=2320716 RepID=A0AAP0GFF6_9ASPA
MSSGGISRFLLGFLQEHFGEPEDLASLPSLTSRLKCECDDREEELLHLKTKLSLAFSSWISQSAEAGMILSRIESGPPLPSQDGRLMSQGKILHLELPLLAKELGRILSVRRYAESALRLEALVGDLEDSASAMIKHVPRKKMDYNLYGSSKQTLPGDESGRRLKNMLVAIKTMQDIEEVLAGFSSTRPRWINLLRAADSRVKNALVILRPQLLTDHRSLIASLGWPPSLLTTDLVKDNFMEMLNPLSIMQGPKKDEYCRSFSALCSLQHLHAKQEARWSFLRGDQTAFNSSGFRAAGEVPFFKCGLWPIDELVKPISSRMEPHFLRWSDQPKFIFALVYKTTRDLIDGVDIILQPLIDKAMLLSCSAREAWVAAMLKILSGYLEREVFPAISENRRRNSNSEVTSTMLHMVDLMIALDRRMKILASSGTRIEISFPAVGLGFNPALSVMSMFSSHSDWLQMWAEMEVEDAEGRLKPQMEDEQCWSVFASGEEKDESFLFSSREDYKAPLIAESVLRSAREMVERGYALPCGRTRNEFISSSATLFLSHFLCALLQRSGDIEHTAAVLDDVRLSRVCGSMNAARYCEHVLQEWNEDATLVETSEYLYKDGAKFSVRLQTDCLEEIVAALLLHFDHLCWNYVRDGGRWEMNRIVSDCSFPDEDYLRVSPDFIEALDTLRDRIVFLRLNLNRPNFVELWRSIAGGIDHFIFASIPMSGPCFSSRGADQFETDMMAVFSIFRPFCARPEAFFPCISDSLKLLQVCKKDADQMLEELSQRRSEDCLRLRGIFHVSPAQAEKVLRTRLLRDWEL